MKKQNVWIIVAVVVIAIIAFLAYRAKQHNPAQTGAADTSQRANQEPAAAPSPAADTGTTGSGAAGNSAYAAALVKYGNNRIQFDAACQAHPNNATFKSGTQVMFDNRALVARKITFNGISHTIPADNYTVVSMTAAKYPATILIDCGSSQNVATVLLQK